MSIKLTHHFKKTPINYEFDIYSDNTTCRNLLNLYNKNDDDNNNKLFDKFKKCVKRILKTKSWIGKQNDVIHENVHIGDKINIEYLTYSQKYIEDYPKLKGTVFYIDKETGDILFFSENKNKIIVHSLERLHCSYYGMSKGYDLFITKE